MGRNAGVRALPLVPRQLGGDRPGGLPVTGWKVRDVAVTLGLAAFLAVFVLVVDIRYVW